MADSVGSHLSTKVWKSPHQHLRLSEIITQGLLFTHLGTLNMRGGGWGVSNVHRQPDDSNANCCSGHTRWDGETERPLNWQGLVLLAYKYTSIFYILSVLAYWEYTKTHHLRNPAVEPSDPDLLMTVEVCGGWGCRSDSGPSSSSSKSDSHWF